jgi:hypothetical protein
VFLELMEYTACLLQQLSDLQHIRSLHAHSCQLVID